MTDQYFCKACGELDDAVAAQIRELEDTVNALGIELAKSRTQITRLRGEQRKHHPPEYEDAYEVALYWREQCMPTAKELEGPRLEKTIARLKAGYTVTDLKTAVWGYRCYPNVADCGKRQRINEGGRRSVDLELIMRDARHVDDGIALAERERRYDQDVLNDGGSRRVASLCDCQHARGSHGLYRLNGHEACMEQGCECNQFDDAHWHFNEWQRKHNGQGALL